MQHHVFVEHEAGSTVAWRRHVGVGNQILNTIQIAIAHLRIWDRINFREVHGLHVRPANQNKAAFVKSKEKGTSAFHTNQESVFRLLMSGRTTVFDTGGMCNDFQYMYSDVVQLRIVSTMLKMTTKFDFL